MTADEWDARLLALVNEKGKFALGLTYDFDGHQGWADAFERGIDKQWFTLVDIAVIAEPTTRGTIMKVFRLTEAGWARRAALAAAGLIGS